jgi:predicted ATPase
MDAHRTAGVRWGRSYYVALLAEAYGQGKQFKKGLTASAEGLTIAEETGERWYEAELYRLKGELTLQSSVQRPESRVKEAEACFLKAIEIARQ